MKLLSNRKLLRVLQYLPIAIILIFTVVLNFFIVKDNKVKVNILVESVRTDVIGTQKQKIKSNIDQLYQQINHEKMLIEQIAREKLRFRVDTAISIANGLLLENQDKPIEEVKQLIIDALRPIRFDGGRGYFYISTLDGMNVMHPIRPELENTSILNRMDSRGNYYIQRKKEELNNKGEAFNHYWYIKPGNGGEEFAKISFDRKFDAFNWYIGSGEYVLDIEEGVQQQVLGMLSSINVDDDGYIFVFDLDGDAKLINQKVITDHSIDVYKVNDELGKLLFNATEKKGFLLYNNKLVEGANLLGPKISYFRVIDGWDWVIGTGFHTNRVSVFIKEKEKMLVTQGNEDLLKLLGLTLPFSLILTFLTVIVGRRVYRHFVTLERQVIDDFERLKLSRNEMQYMAKYDQLTDLPNRMQLTENIEKLIALSKLQNKKAAIVFVDLDDFKRINDQYGHAAGDQLLKQIGQRFETILGHHDCVSRFGGDEFIFCFSMLDNHEGAKCKVRQIQTLFMSPFLLDGVAVATKCSIGVSIYPDHGANSEELISKADIVLYKSKEEQKGDVMFYNADINQQVQYNTLLENQLNQAVKRNEISVVYQPQINTETQEIESVEALCRWHNPELGIVSPLEFIPVAERIGVIHDLGDYVFHLACRDTLALMPNGENAIGVSINISPKQLARLDFEQRVMAIVQESGIDIDRVTLEITENIFIDDLATVSPVLQRLRGQGFGISLDDFGTGYSSLNYLNNLPISEIKIDRSFVDKLLNNKQSDTLVKAIIAIGSSCQMKVVAEGVETLAQHEKLKEYHCDLLQGYYFDKPLNIDDLIKRYAERKEVILT